MGAEKGLNAATIQCAGILRAHGWHVSRRVGDVSFEDVEEEVRRCRGEARAAALLIGARLARKRSETRIKAQKG